MNLKKCFILTLFFTIPWILSAQPQLEKLNRGLVAIKVPEGVFLSWRLQGFERIGVAFNLYRDEVKINSKPITGPTNYSDIKGTTSSKYSVAAIYDGIEQARSWKVSVWKTPYLEIPLRKLEGNYEPNDASVGDLDGDGEYEIVIKRIPQSVDTSYSCKYFPFIEAYKLDGTFLWAANMGPNHLNFVEIDFTVYDFNGDGKSEIALRNCEGFIDGTGDEIVDTDGDGITNYRNYQSYHPYVLKGPEFISVLDGKTGKLLTRDKYIERDPVTQWGGGGDLNKAIHRAKKFMLSPAYLDGIHPFLVICRGTYHKIILEAWNFRNSKLSKQWRFNSDEWPGYESSGNHNMSVADVDNDGRDEIIYGSCVIDDDGKGLHTTGMGHGDALHVSDLDPDRPGLEIWQYHEDPKYSGATLRDALTGETLVNYKSPRDQGRACAANILSGIRGAELWGSALCPFFDVKGKIIGQPPMEMNFLVYWDGDLERELLDHSWKRNSGTGFISKYLQSGQEKILLDPKGTLSNNYTKGNPCLSADIFGDWREEVIWRTEDNRAIRIYTTDIPTNYRLYTLMHDPQYRIAIAWQQNSYNQPPHPSFYLGDEFIYAPASPATSSSITWTGEQEKWDTQSKNGVKNGILTRYSNGDSILFGTIKPENSMVHLKENVFPKHISVFSPNNFTIAGTGKISGKTSVIKSGKGKLIFNNDNDYSGLTEIWDGALVVNGNLSSPGVVVYGGIFGGVKSGGKTGGRLTGKGTLRGSVTLESKGCISPGDDTAEINNLVIEKNLNLKGFSYACFDVHQSPNLCDKIDIKGDLILSDSASFLIHDPDGVLTEGDYDLVQYGGSLKGNLTKLKIIGILSGTLVDKNKKIVLQIKHYNN